MNHRAPRLFALATATFGLALALAAPSSAQHHRSRPAPAAADAPIPLLGELHTAAACPSTTSPYRVWCIAADGFATGTAAPLPPDDVALLGFTIELAVGRPVESALTDRVTLAALALRHVGGGVSGKIRSITPSNPDESQQMARAVMNLTMVFKGLAPTAPVEAGLAGYVATIPRAAEYPVRRGPHGWLIAGASNAELRRVGDYWVAVETPASGRGIFVSLFTDRFTPQR